VAIIFITISYIINTVIAGVHLRTNKPNSHWLKPKILAWNYQVSALTDAHSWTLAEWNICVFRSRVYVFLCETVWIELFRLWVIRLVMVQGVYRDINPGTGWKYYCSISIRGRQFVVAASYAIQKRKCRIFPQRLCEHRNNLERCEI